MVTALQIWSGEVQNNAGRLRESLVPHILQCLTSSVHMYIENIPILTVGKCETFDSPLGELVRHNQKKMGPILAVRSASKVFLVHSVLHLIILVSIDLHGQHDQSIFTA